MHQSKEEQGMPSASPHYPMMHRYDASSPIPGRVPIMPFASSVTSDWDHLQTDNEISHAQGCQALPWLPL